MNRKTYYGSINAFDNAGRLLKWTGRAYDYVTKYGKAARTLESLDRHEFYCPTCVDIELRELREE